MRFLLPLLVCINVTAAQPGDQPARAEVSAHELDSAILSRELGQFWGQVLVASKGEIVLAKGYGLADASLRPLDDHTIMDVGSIAKQFTAAAILKLEMQGRLTTDDPVSKFFPEAGGRADDITLYQLLSHTSGLSDGGGAIQSLTFRDRDLAVRKAMNSRGSSKPGERFEYCNGGYVVLGAVIERAAGTTFEAYLKKELFGPAGMTSTGFLSDQDLDISNSAMRVVERAGRPRRTSIMGDGWGWGFKGCGGVLTNVHDLLKWDRALRAGTILDEVAKAKLYNVVQDSYALGWHVERTSTGRRVHHSGGTRGFRAQYSRDLEDDLVIAVITNERHDPVRIADELRRLARGETSSGATLRVAADRLNEHGLVSIAAGCKLEVVPHGTSFTIRVREESLQVPLMESTLDRSQLEALASDLKTAIRRNEGLASAKQALPQETEVVLATAPYERNADGAFTLPESAKWVAMPEYRSTGGVDHRPILVLQDSDNSFWPVIIKMHPDAAKAFAERCDAAMAP